ncbi:3-dehydroquinate synthase II [Pseudomonas otitidis]|uniref:3-dehydroquinate synthase II n=1 Tax=Metapseudomonas otitidis TaxID=319939 RepID=UPI00244B1863|nr:MULTISPECIES: 3-dehydroquinate synthase II [Pseudomonas]MDH1107704.1 3-dehydroquinate synthase II [Pseudomonas otitidis]MDH1161747.1 3-dehydroquinate synthase II [Pseudomonas otitidis]MDH1166763.1 3-dehydroquinate synthase II [Pseudomonas otitidis]MDL5596675.1 3-dehydroquinate synthase II [Bacillus subtilis]
MSNTSAGVKGKDVQITKEVAVPQDFETPETISRRSSVRLANIRKAGESKRTANDSQLVWFDSAQLASKRPDDGIFVRVINSLYTGIVLYLDNLAELLPAVPARMHVVLRLRNAAELKAFREGAEFEAFKKGAAARNRSVALNDAEALAELGQDGLLTCFTSYVDDRDSLLGAIDQGLRFNYLWILFRDPTNIPLELVIASLQPTSTVLMKEIKAPTDVDDAIVSYGVMEYGAEGVIFSPRDHGVMSEFLARMSQAQSYANLNIQVGTVIDSRPVGMGYRACIDAATLFEPDEGMLVGSTSQGGVLCCPEVYFLPYMELRPFRVNAGAVHSYVFNTDNRTDYMSELKAGSPIMIVNSKGRVRRAAVGRMKIEQRPLRLIEVEFPGKERVNVLMQDDWHVRIFSDAAKPLNISELKPGDKVLGYVTEPGRHVGIKINESIIEK